MRVICTAGHVDHGKSALVRALTGMEPDRFAEEQRRGLTIDLGFAWTRLGSPPRTLAFVDLPGHERFVPNMLAGAGAVDLALFVVAADEGWMPQSGEHLAILDLLGVSRGVVALTKVDLVDREREAEVAADVRARLAATAFAAAELVSVSARSGCGLDDLRARLLALVDAAPPPPDRGRPRLWVDRVFSVRGAGTVVTGTLAGGRLRTGDALAVLPGRRQGRVRGLQTLKEPTDEALPGSRVAVNLSGVERSDVGRGDALGVPEQWLSVRAFDAWVRALPGAVVDRRGAWHVHIGSGERTARLTPVAGRPVDDAGGHVRVELDRAVAVTAGDRFVLREAGRRATLGGGVVLDCDPPPRPRGRDRATRVAALDARHAALAADDRAALLALAISERGSVPIARVAAATGLTPADAVTAARQQRLPGLADAVVAPEAATRWAAAVRAALAAHHARVPVDRAAPRDVAERAALEAGCPARLVAPLLERLVQQAAIVAEGPGLRTPEHRVRLDAAQAHAREALLAALRAEPFAPPRLSQAAARAGASVALVRELEAAGDLVRVDDDLAVTGDAVEAAAARLREAYAREGPLTAARAKQVLGTTRKYAIPLLGELDRRGVTRRAGDLRHVVG